LLCVSLSRKATVSLKPEKYQKQCNNVAGKRRESYLYGQICARSLKRPAVRLSEQLENLPLDN